MAAVKLNAGRYEATFRPDCAMLCASLQFRGEEYVAWPRPISQFRAGNATAIPPLHPWSNRLGRWSYTAAGRRVSLRGLTLPTDQNGLPIHGNLFGVAFDVVRADDTRVVGRLDYGAYPDKLRAFPFPHVLTIDARLDPERGLTITTEVRPTGETAVPVSFGWHPYLKLPAGARTEWELRWPACEHVEVDKHTIPTGVRTPLAAQRAPIASRTFDDHYALGRDRRFSIAAEGRSLTLRFEPNYPYGQLFVPPRKQIVAIEPMTATIDALGAGTAPLVEPGDRFRAAFSLQADADVS
jgi:galactose mutarotase-like enzyme